MNKAKMLARSYNAQKFAEGTQTQTTLLPGLSAEMKTYYEMSLLDNAEPNLIHNQFGDEYDIPKRGGKTIEFRKYDPLPKALTPITEGVTPAGNKLNVTTITATVSQYGDYIQMSDMLELTAIDNNLVESTTLLGSQAGRTIDTVTREVLNGGTNVMYAPIDNGDGTFTKVESRSQLNTKAKLSTKLIFKAAALLKANNAGYINDSYVAIIHPYAAYDLMTSSDWMDVHKYAKPENIYEGEIGKIGKVRFVESSEAKIAEGGAGGAKVFCTIVLAAHAYAKTKVKDGGLKHIVKQLGYGDDPLDQRSSSGWKATHVAKRLCEAFMVRIESCSEFSEDADVN